MTDPGDRPSALLLCAGLLLLVAATGCETRPKLVASNPVNVLIVLLDTVRSDRLSCYGYQRPVTPHIDRIAAEGVLFERCYANAPWTLPSHASLFTGQYSAAHRANQETLSLSEGRITLAEIFSLAGYRTFGSSSNPIVSRSSGLARGFDEFLEIFRRDLLAEYQEDNRHPNNVALERFLDRRGKPPFFAFLNYVDAHLPYDPPEPFRSRFLRDDATAVEIDAASRIVMKNHYLSEDGLDERELAILGDLYDGEIAHLDAQIGELVEMLRSRNLLEETLIVITSDHGENIGDHDHFGHVFSIHDTLLRVPLIIRLPGEVGAATVRADPAQLHDLLPTLLAYCGIEPVEGSQGRDLLAPEAATTIVPALAEYYYPRQVLSVFKEPELEEHGQKFLPFLRRLRSLHEGRYKLVWSSNGEHELYDVVDDPGELDDLARAEPRPAALRDLATRLSRLIEQVEGEPALPPPPPPGWRLPGFEESTEDPELLERLRALGYVG